MSLADKYKKKTAALAEERQRLAVERARSSIKSIMESDQFKLSALALPESQMAVDAIVQNTVKTVLDPVGQILDTLRAKCFRNAEIRKLVHNLHETYKLEPHTDSTVFEDMVGPVAEFILAHQELYNTFDPEMLRDEKVSE